MIRGMYIPPRQYRQDQMLVSLHVTHASAGGIGHLNEILPWIEGGIDGILDGSDVIDEYVVIRTCNRLEAYVATEDNHGARLLLEKAMRKTIPYDGRNFWYILQDDDCIRHLFSVVCGMDSLIVGEDQIQHQIRDAFMRARETGHVGKILYALFNNAIIVGKRVRTETDLNKGAVSVGYAAIELAEKEIGTLDGKSIAIVGAGDMAGVIAKNLVGKGPETVFVTNRTFERALELAKELDGMAVKMDRLVDMVARSDVVLVATSATHDVITLDVVVSAMCQRPEKPLLIIDVSLPVNTSEKVTSVDNVKLFTMASLDAIAAENVARRKGEISRAERIIRQEMARIEDERKTREANAVIREYSMECERIRREEAERAKCAIGDSSCDKVIEDMSHSIVKMISAEFIKNLRKAAIDGDRETCEAAAKLLGIRLSEQYDVSRNKAQKTQED